MELTLVAGGNCGRDDCPAVFTTDRGTIAIQGYLVAKQAPAGEAVVEVPKSLLQETVRALGW